jgi:hypothetical protein
MTWRNYDDPDGYIGGPNDEHGKRIAPHRSRRVDDSERPPAPTGWIQRLAIESLAG